MSHIRTPSIIKKLSWFHQMALHIVAIFPVDVRHVTEYFIKHPLDILSKM